jgi:molecular chaperone GrpE
VSDDREPNDTQQGQNPWSGGGQVSTEQQLQELQQQLHEAQQRVLRTQADQENYRRRLRRDTEEELKFAAQPLVTDLLPVVDNIQRAIDAADKSQDPKGLLDGIKMVAQQLSSVLEKHRCTRIQANGVPFDPRLHEAVAQRPSTQQPPGTVLEVHQDGYQLHDRVIRPAQVVVSSAVQEVSDEE